MAFNFSFREIGNTRDIRDLTKFISAQDLGYPDYDAWVQRTEAELFDGSKQVVMAFSDSHLVGDIIYQDHKELPQMLEVKNLRVHPYFRIRSFGGFMLRQSEVEASRRSYQGVIVDTRPEQTDVVQFLSKQGYIPIATGPLYEGNSPDITLMKTLNPLETSDILTIGKKFIEGRFL